MSNSWTIVNGMSNVPLCSLPRDKASCVEISNSFLEESQGKAASTFKMASYHQSPQIFAKAVEIT